MKTTRIIAFANHKGGVGKTTTTASVGSILAQKGFKVLVIDMDAQANLTGSLLKIRPDDEEPEQTIYHALTGRCTLPYISINDNLSICPASLQLAMVDSELASAIARERILSNLLTDKVKEQFDFILIDCPPSLGLVTLNAITACTDIIIPLVAEILPFKGLTMINNFVNQVHSLLNSNAHISGILITRWESTKLSRTVENLLRQQLGDTVFTTKIRKNVSVAEAPLEAQNIVEYAPKSNGATDYRQFTDEMLVKLGVKV